MKKIFFLLLLVITGAAHGQDFWTALNGPYGAAVADHIVHPSGAIILASQANGLWRSTNQGTSWTRITVGNDAAFTDLDMDALNNLYVVTNTGPSRIYKSTDGGLTWLNINSTGIACCNAVTKIRVASANRFYAVTNSNVVHRSTNGGASFSLTSTDITTTVNDLDVSPLNPDHIYVSTQGSGVKISEDGGLTFATPVISGSISNSTTVYQLVFASNGVAYALTTTGPHKKANTSTGTNDWAAIKGAIPDVSFGGTIGLNPSATTLFFANTGSNKLYSTPAASNFGATGTTFANHFLPNIITAISDTQLFMTSQYLGPYYSSNSGASWTEATGGLTAFSQRSAYETSQGRLFINHNGFGYLQSIDNGENWTTQSASPANRYISGFLRLFDASVVGFGFSGTIRSTGTIGNSWTQQSVTTIQQAATYDGVTLFSFTGANTLLKSTDQGVTWVSTAITGLSGSIIEIQVDAYNTAWVRAFNGGNALLFKIASGATTATQVGSNAIDFSIYSANNTTPTVVTILNNGSALSYSTDGGATFAFRSIPSINFANQVWTYRRNVLMTTNGSNNISVSFDGGSTWTLQALPETTAKVVDLTRVSGDRILVSTSGGNSYISTSTVIPPAAPTNLKLVSFRNNLAIIQWDDNSDNEESFFVEQSRGNNTSFSNYVEAGSYVNSQNKVFFSAEAVPNTDIYYRVYAKNDAGSSTVTNEIMVRSSPPCASSIPDNKSWTVTTVADVGFATNGTGPFMGYDVGVYGYGNNQFQADFYSNASNYFLAGQNPPYRPLVVDNLTFFEDCGIISPSTSGSYTADVSNGNGTWNAGTKTFTLKWQAGPQYRPYKATSTFVQNPSDPLPAVPSVKTFVYSSTEVLLSWSFVGFETENKIYRATNAAGPYNLVTTIAYPKTFLIDKGLTTGATYFYKVTAKNATGESAQSSESAITIGATLFRPVENEIQSNYESQQGISWIDADGDGDEDIASPSFVDANLISRSPVFYENAGGGSFIRKDLAAVADENIDVTRGVGVFDFNNDGKLDMYLTKNNNITPDYLLLNGGNWNFTKKTFPDLSPTGTTFKGMGLIDYDRDGFTDILLGNDNGSVSPASLKPTLGRNIGGNTFDVVTTTGLTSIPLNARNLGFADFDSDGDPDVVMLNNSSNATLANALFKNNGNGTFTKVTGTILDSDLPFAPRTCSWGDIDNDGDMDLFIGNQGATGDYLYKNNGDGTFVSVGGATAETSPTYGSSFGDIDNDGDLDLFVINTTANGIFINNGSGTFSKYAGAEVLTHPEVPNIGGAFGDYDNDGFLDFVAAKTGSGAVNLPNMLLKNTLTASAARNWLEVKLIGTVSNRAAIGARVKVVTTSPARTQIREVQGLTGYGSQSSLIQHFGLGTAVSVSSIEVWWPNGKKQTYPGVTSNQKITLTEDATAPSLTLSPANGATGVKTNTKFELTVSETSTPVAGKFFKLYSSLDPVTPVVQADVTTFTVAGNVYSYALTAAQTLVLNSVYNATIDAGAFVDVAQNGSAAVGVVNWTFTTEQDTEKPKLTVDPGPLALLEAGFPAMTFNVTATDNIKVESLRLFRRKISEANWTMVLAGSPVGNAFPVSIQNTYANDMGFEYYVEASDAAGNVGRSPEGTGIYSSRIKYTTDANKRSISFPTNGKMDSWKIISVPYDMPVTQIATLLNLGASGPQTWRMLHYNVVNPDVLTTQSWLEIPTLVNFERGKGYFVNSKLPEAASIKLSDASAPDYNRNNLFKMNFRKGWNQIGNPYLINLNWDDIILYNGAAGVLGHLQIYTNGYTGDPQLLALQGGFVFSEQALTNVAFSFPGQTAGTRTETYTFGDVGSDSWKVDFTLQHGDFQSVAAVGMHPLASNGRDQFDDVNPPRFFNYYELKFNHPEHFYKFFSKDVVTTSNEHMWEFNPDTNLEGTSVLTWDAVKSKNGMEIYLYDVDRQEPIDMTSRASYTFDPTRSTRFRVFYGSDVLSKIKPAKTVLGTAYPNPANATTTIPFSLPEKNGTLAVRLEVFDMVGKKVATLVHGDLGPGFYKVDWQVDASSGLSANQAGLSTGQVGPHSDGIYIYRLTVDGGSEGEVLTGKVLIKK